jgi:NAD(P)H dehydrogenase (quinone)
MSAASQATRPDYATAAAAALLHDDGRNRTCELGGPAFDLPQLARVISGVTGYEVTYRNLQAGSTPMRSSNPAWIGRLPAL